MTRPRKGRVRCPSPFIRSKSRDFLGFDFTSGLTTCLVLTSVLLLILVLFLVLVASLSKSPCINLGVCDGLQILANIW